LPIKVLITGITGQDGSYLAELLLKKGYEVHGIVRRVAIEDPNHKMWRINHILKDIRLHVASIENFPSIVRTFRDVNPDECYHLASQSFVSYYFDDEFSTLNTNINGTHSVLSALNDFSPQCRFYFAGTSEMFGKAPYTPQDENTPFNPRSSYGISKVAGFFLTKNYRNNNNLFACNGILFNHESPRRGYEYVTRKITSHAAKIKLGKTKELTLGNLDAKRDWGHSREYVYAMWLMLQQDKADDFVLSSGEIHSVREFCETAFSYVNLNYQDYVKIDERYFRPSETEILTGNPAKAKEILGWQNRIKFTDLVQEMVETDLEIESKNRT
jgi:GDPmannose 4,6-dehydratase